MNSLEFMLGVYDPTELRTTVLVDIAFYLDSCYAFVNFGIFRLYIF